MPFRNQFQANKPGLAADIEQAVRKDGSGPAAIRSLPAAAPRCSVWFGGLPPEAGDQPTGPPDVALVVLAEPFPEELLLRGRLNAYPNERDGPEEPKAD